MDVSSTIYKHLGQVNDPEIPVLSLHDMGILRAVNVLQENDERHAQALQRFRTSHPDAPKEHADHVYEIVISPTYVGCPAMDRMSQDIEEAMFVRQLLGDGKGQLAHKHGLFNILRHAIHCRTPDVSWAYDNLIDMIGVFLGGIGMAHAKILECLCMAFVGLREHFHRTQNAHIV